MNVICINDKNKPLDYQGDWIVEGNVYSVIKEVVSVGNKNIRGYVLREVSPIPFTEYNCFRVDRFRKVSDDELMMIALNKQLEKNKIKPIVCPTIEVEEFTKEFETV